METLKTKPEGGNGGQELGDETFMSAEDLRNYMTEMQMAKATTSVDGILLSVRVIDFATGQLISSAETRFKGDAFLASLINKPRSAPLIKISN